MGHVEVRSGDLRTTRIRWSLRVMSSSRRVLELGPCSVVGASGIGCGGEMGTGEGILEEKDVDSLLFSRKAVNRASSEVWNSKAVKQQFF